MLNRLGVSSNFINICKNIYSDSKFRVKTTNGFSNLIFQKIEVKQGCPLSPLLFNLIIQALLIGLDNSEGGYTFNNQLRLNYFTYAPVPLQWGLINSEVLLTFWKYKLFQWIWLIKVMITYVLWLLLYVCHCWYWTLFLSNKCCY